MARPTWTGAITFGGFPIHLVAYTLVKSRSAESFKTLCACHGAPISQKAHCVDTDEVLEREDTNKGIAVSKDKYAVLPDEAIDMIRSAERSDTLEIHQFARAGSVPLHLATGHYRLVPNPKVPGSEQPASILWNGLYGTDRAVVTDWTPRAGSRDALLVIHANSFGISGTTLPWDAEFTDAPEHSFDVDEKAQAVFEQFIEAQGYDLGEFAHERWESTYAKRRADAIEKALAGEVIEMPTKAPETQAAPDLMAAMTAALGEAKAKPKKKPAKKATPGQVAA